METTEEKPKRVPGVRSRDEYQRIPYVNYWRFETGRKPKRINWMCFGLMGEQGAGVPDAVRYIAPIAPTLAGGEPMRECVIDFYLGFMHRLLHKSDLPMWFYLKGPDFVEFTLDTRGLKYKFALFFLTWFRYVHQYPDLLNLFYHRAHLLADDEAVFREFQEVHHMACRSKVRMISPQWANEILMYRYFCCEDDWKFIALDQLFLNIQRNRGLSHVRVQDYFK